MSGPKDNDRVVGFFFSLNMLSFFVTVFFGRQTRWLRYAQIEKQTNKNPHQSNLCSF